MSRPSDLMGTLRTRVGVLDSCVTFFISDCLNCFLTSCISFLKWRRTEYALKLWIFHFVYSSMLTNPAFAAGLAGLACKLYELYARQTMTTSASVGTGVDRATVARGHCVSTAQTTRTDNKCSTGAVVKRDVTYSVDCVFYRSLHSAELQLLRSHGTANERSFFVPATMD